CFCIHDTEAFATSVGQQDERRDRVGFVMCLERRVQIDVSNDLSIDHDERLVLEKLARVVERAAGAEYHRLLHVIQFHPDAAAISQHAPHRLRTMMQVHDNLIDTVAGQVFGDISNERFSENWYCGLGAVFSEWPKACAVAGRKNDRAHRWYRSGSLGGVAHDE